MSFGLPLSAGMEALCPFRSPCPGLFPYIKDEDGGSRLSGDRGSPIDSLLPQARAVVTAWGLRAQAGEKRNRQTAAGRLALRARPKTEQRGLPADRKWFGRELFPKAKKAGLPGQAGKEGRLLETRLIGYPINNTGVPDR